MYEIADGVWQLPLVPRDGINAYLIGDVLVDTGIKQSAAKITNMLDGRNVSAVALTHAHGDHAGSINRLAARLGAPVWCGLADREATETGRPVLPARIKRPRLGALVNAAVGFDGVPVARTLTEGDTLTAGFVVYDTPGHSPGHVSFWREADRTLICGDVFFNMRVRIPIAGLRQPLQLATPDPAKNRESERKLSALEPATVGFGHGPVLKGDAARKLSAFIRQLPSAESAPAGAAIGQHAYRGKPETQAEVDPPAPERRQTSSSVGAAAGDAARSASEARSSEGR